jgi:protein-S-isoprenylcysteine O-methyltransferase Ste14
MNKMPLDPTLVSRCIEVLWIFWGVCWFALAFGNKRTIYRQSRRSRLLYFSVAIVAVMIESHLVPRRFKLYDETLWTQTIGLGFCAGGIAIALWARRFLGSNWSGLITLKENHELIRSGPYRFVRHPIYFGLILAVAGTIIAIQPTVRGILFFLLITVGFKLKSLGEEKILIPEFPEDYPRYQREVKALIPFIW